MARGCQVQSHRNVEGQREDREVPLAEDGIQGTGKNGAEDGRDKGFITVIILKSTQSHQLCAIQHPLSLAQTFLALLNSVIH